MLNCLSFFENLNGFRILNLCVLRFENQLNKFFLKKLLFIFISLICLLPPVLAQEKYTISGQIEDKASGERLFGANIYESKELRGTTSNLYGFYSLTLPKDTHTIVISYVGFETITQKVYLDKNQTLNIQLSSSVNLQEVVVSAEAAEKIHEQTQMSIAKVSMREIENLPALLGEKDLIKTVQLLPGVQSGSEGSSGLYVRGGGPDQNLILLDGVPVYNANHLFGFFSVFNSDAISGVDLIKGGFPARYGGRLSSVLDIHMKEGNNKKLSGAASIGIISSKLMLEGPIGNENTSFAISARRTYIDLLTQPFILLAQRGNDNKISGGYYFYDVNAKVNHKLNDKNRLFLSTYLGNDKAYVKEKYSYESSFNETITSKNNAGLKWGNITSALRWNHIFSNKIFVNTTLTYSKYKFDVGFKSLETIESSTTKEEISLGYNYISGIDDWGAKVDVDYLPNPNHYIKFGVNETYHVFTPGVSVFKSTGDGSPIDTAIGASIVKAHEISVYIEDDLRLGSRIKINLGIRLSSFNVNRHTYFNPEPRISVNFSAFDNTSLKVSYSRMAQYLHLLSNATVGLPTDLWVPVTDTIKPMRADQVAIGVAHTHKNKYEFSIEAYYKLMNNVIEYKDGASFFSGTDWQKKVETGKGEAYGVELFAQKKLGKTTGWIGYTLSWTTRQFENINKGEKFPYKFDRRHDIGIAVVHNLKENVTAGLTWVFGTGNAITLPVSTFSGYAPNELINTYSNEPFENFRNYGSRNGFRMPSYHRLDLSISFMKKKKRYERTWTYGLYNAYNNRNPFYLDFETNRKGEKKLYQYSLFPIIPAVAWSIKF